MLSNEFNGYRIYEEKKRICMIFGKMKRIGAIWITLNSSTVK